MQRTVATRGVASELEISLESCCEATKFGTKPNLILHMSRSYRLQYDSEFVTGSNAEEQILFGSWGEQFLVLFFNFEGHLLEKQFLEGRDIPDIIRNESPELIESWKKETTDQIAEEFGMERSAIDIKKFHLKHQHIRIEDLPEDLAEYEQKPDDSKWTSADHEEKPALIQEWHESGKYIFYWDRAHLVALDGTIL